MVMIVGGPLVLAEEETTTLNGEIEVAEYGDDGSPESVMVYDSEWGSVLISKEGKGGELLSHVGAIATLTGTIVELEDDGDYSYAIVVKSYSIDEPAEPDGR
jgi:hypothetical protein